ncbi:Iron-type alcohol dehydrogenase-like protein, partial [Aduncisulcus paluster]
LPRALADPKDLRARYWLHYAAAIAGMAFDESLLHITHAAEHTLSAYVPDLTHGLGLALIQPGVIRHVWPKAGKVLASVLEPMLDGLTGEPAEAEEAFRRMRKWHQSVGVTETMATIGYTKEDVPKLVKGTEHCPGMDGLLALSPVKCTPKDLGDIYMSGFFD